MPQFLKRKLRETYPHLSVKGGDLVEHGLRRFFVACSRRKNSLWPCLAQSGGRRAARVHIAHQGFPALVSFGPWPFNRAVAQ